MNCIYVSEIFRSVGMMTSVLTPFECGSFTKLFSKDRANKYFSKNMVVFFAGGTGLAGTAAPEIAAADHNSYLYPFVHKLLYL